MSDELRIPAVLPADKEAEELVLGAIMLAPAIISSLTAELRLNARHFYYDVHGRIFDAMLRIVGRGDGLDPQVIAWELGETTAQGRAVLELLAGPVPAVGNVRQYARRVIEFAEWRGRLANIYDRLQAVAQLDEQAYRDAAARDELVAAGAAGDGLLTPDDLASAWVDRYEASHSPAMPTPWPAINDGLFGGLRSGDVSVWGGWPGMGKSTALDQVMSFLRDIWQKRGETLRACAYVNEMDEIDRVSRLIAGRAQVSFERIMKRTLTPNEIAAALKAAPDLPFAIQPCAGWSVDAIARHARHYRWDICAVDHATRIPARDVADWDHVSRTLADAARQSRAHIMVAVQLNRERAATPVRPMPVLRDLRGTGAWEQDARAVLFVHRREEINRDTGLVDTLEDGVIHLAKVNNGRTGAAERVFLNYPRMRWELDNTQPGAETPF